MDLSLTQKPHGNKNKVKYCNTIIRFVPSKILNSLLRKVLKLNFKTEVQEMFCAALHLQISYIISYFFYHTQQTVKSTKHIFCSPVMHELVKVKNLIPPSLATVYPFSVQDAMMVCCAMLVIHLDLI